MEDKPGFKDIIGQLKKNPLLLGVIVAGIVGVLFIIYKQNQQIQSAGSSTTPGVSSGSMGAAVPTVNLNQQFYGAKTQGESSIGATAPSGDNTPLHLQPQTNATSMTSPSDAHTLQIRQSGGIAQVASYDKSASGVPVWSSPNATPGSQIGTIDFGASVAELGASVQGGSNFGPGSSGGSNMWYKINTSGGKTGYVSAYDVQSVK